MSSMALGSLRADTTRVRRYSWAHYLAIIGIPILVWEAWTVVAWLLDGPHAITEFRGSTTTRIAARTLETLAVLVSLVVGTWVVRGCLRERTLTFDALFCIAATSIWFGDLSPNFFQPIILYSSEWINLNSPCGNQPFIVNPDCGRVPDPILFMLLLEVFGLLVLAIGMGKFMQWARGRWPASITWRSVAKMLLVMLAVAVVLDLLIEIPLIALGLWSYPGSPEWMSLSFGSENGARWTALEIPTFGLWMASIAAIRYFKNDRGETLVERGLQRHPPRIRKAITLMALFSFFNLSTWTLGTIPLLPLGPYSDKWPALPAHLLNDVCDLPSADGGAEDETAAGGTAYGPCPGNPGYRMPGRTSTLLDR